MEQSRTISKQGYWFTGFTLVFMIIELVVILVFKVFLCHNHHQSRASSYAAPPVSQP